MFQACPVHHGLPLLLVEEGRDCLLQSKVASVPCLGDWGLVQVLLEEERGAVYQGERAGELEISNIEL